MDAVKFIKKLKDKVWEEGVAGDTYEGLAREALDLGFGAAAGELRRIANDEFRHREKLEAMVRGLEVTLETALELAAEEPSCPPPKTYGDWVNLAADIKDRYPDDPVMRATANTALAGILAEEQRSAGWSPESAAEGKRWLMEKAGELGIR